MNRLVKDRKVATRVQRLGEAMHEDGISPAVGEKGSRLAASLCFHVVNQLGSWLAPSRVADTYSVTSVAPAALKGTVLHPGAFAKMLVSLFVHIVPRAIGLASALGRRHKRPLLAETGRSELRPEAVLHRGLD